MSLEVFQACVNGYSDHLFDMQVLGVQSGYWAGYFGRAKKPRSLKSVLEKFFRLHSQNREKAKSEKIEKPAVDVEAFQAMEQQFLARYNK